MNGRGSSNSGDSFEHGLTLFNRGEFFACHEAWEEAWLSARGDDKIFYEGMIQAAVAILHAERGNRNGAASTWRKARAKLETFPEIHHGIVLGELREALADFFKRMLEREPAVELPQPPTIKRRS